MDQASEKYNTELDQQLQKIAIEDWTYFVQLVGEGSILLAKVCLLKKNNKSHRMVSRKLSISKSQVETNCKKCPTISDSL